METESSENLFEKHLLDMSNKFTSIHHNIIIIIISIITIIISINIIITMMIILFSNLC